MKKKISFVVCCLFLVFITSNAFAQSSLFERFVKEKTDVIQELAQESVITTFESLEIIDNDDDFFELAAAILPNSTVLASIIAINDLEISPEEKADKLTREAVLGLSCNEWLQITVIAYVVDYFIGVIPNSALSLLVLVWLLCYVGII